MVSSAPSVFLGFEREVVYYQWVLLSYFKAVTMRVASAIASDSFSYNVMALTPFYGGEPAPSVWLQYTTEPMWIAIARLFGWALFLLYN